MEEQQQQPQQPQFVPQLSLLPPSKTNGSQEKGPSPTDAPAAWPYGPFPSYQAMQSSPAPQGSCRTNTSASHPPAVSIHRSRTTDKPGLRRDSRRRSLEVPWQQQKVGRAIVHPDFYVMETGLMRSKRAQTLTLLLFTGWLCPICVEPSSEEEEGQRLPSVSSKSECIITAYRACLKV